MVLVSEENISGIDTHFRKYRIGGIDTFGIVLPITNLNAKISADELTDANHKYNILNRMCNNVTDNFTSES